MGQVKTHRDPFYIFSGGQDPQSRIYASSWHYGLMGSNVVHVLVMKEGTDMPTCKSGSFWCIGAKDVGLKKMSILKFKKRDRKKVCKR